MLLKRLLLAGAAALVLISAPGVAQAETLREALESAYRNNPNIMNAYLSVKMSAEDIALRKAGKLPQISASARVGGSFSQDGTGLDTGYDYQLGLTYQQNLFDSFRTESQIEQARGVAEVSKYTLRLAEQNVLLSVASAYMNVVRDRQLVAFRLENVGFFERQLESSQSRLDLGEGTQIEVSQSQTRLAATRAAYRAAQASLQASEASYVRWVGHEPGSLESRFDFNGKLPRSVEAAVALAEEQNPGILTARAAVRVAQSGADAAKAAFGPTLNLIGNLCGLGCFADPTQGGMSGSVNLTLSIPIYSGGSLGAGVRKANLDQIRSEVDALATRDEVRESVISAWSSIASANAQIEAAQSQVESAQLVVEGTIEERDVGQRTTLDVLNAQADLISARETLIQATAGRVVASFSLLAATGQLSPEGLGLRVATYSADDYQATVEDVWQELRAVDER